MEHDVLLMLLTGAGLLALSRLARALPGGGTLESSPNRIGRPRSRAELAQGLTPAHGALDATATARSGGAAPMKQCVLTSECTGSGIARIP